MKFKYAFTLAEVLITLVIVGIIAAMTIPVLMNKINKHVVEVKLKEDYSILQQAMMRANNDMPFNSYVADNNTGVIKKWIYTYLLPYMKVEKICYNTVGCWQKKYTYDLAGNIPSAWAQKIPSVGIGANVVTIRLSNGTNLCLDAWMPDGGLWSNFGIKADVSELVIFIDANGDYPPNIIGKDIYIMAFAPDGIVPAGSDVSKDELEKDCSKNSSRSYAGAFCLKKVQQDGWEISDDVWNR